jgi:hypothetical protein
MTIALIGLAAWCAILTLIVLACIRQIAILDVRVDRQLFSGTEPVEDGLELGQPVPAEVAALIPAPAAGPWFVVLLSSTCTTCRDLAFEMQHFDLDAPVLGLVAGRSEVADVIAEVLPAGVTTTRDPQATAAAAALAVKTTPFVFEFRRGTLVAKAAVRGADHLKRFMAEAGTVSDEELAAAINREEGTEHARAR